MKPLRAGVFGLGGVAARHAAAIVSLHGEVELAACCGRDPERTAAFAARFGGAAYLSLERMLDEAALDLLVIATPPFARAQAVQLAASRGVHLLVEKPLALSNEDAARMVEAVAAAGIKTQAGFMYRFGAAVARWKELQAADEAGPIGLFAGSFHCNSLHAPWWREREKSGGQMVEQLIHLVDLVRYFMGEPASAYARAANLFHRATPRYDSEDVSAIVFGFESGAIATLNAANAAVPGVWAKEWRVLAERMTGGFANWNSARFTWTRDGGREETVSVETDVFAAQLIDLVVAIREGRPTLAPIAEGAKSLRLALAARRSAEERREIVL